eukprot:1310756-Rhodomonas_salina.5
MGVWGSRRLDQRSMPALAWTSCQCLMGQHADVFVRQAVPSKKFPRYRISGFLVSSQCFPSHFTFVLGWLLPQACDPMRAVSTLGVTSAYAARQYRASPSARVGP